MSDPPRVKKVVPVGYADISQFIRLDGDAEPMAITYGIKVASGPLTLSHVLAIRAAYMNSFLTWMTPAYKVASTRAAYSVDAGDPVVIEGGGNTAGTDTVVGQLPQNCALLVNKLTGSGGRRNRGRMYVPGVLNEAGVSDLGMVGYFATIQLDVSSFLTSLTSEPGTNVEDMVIFHSYEYPGDIDPGPPGGFPAPTVVTDLVVQEQIATQRRRLRR